METFDVSYIWKFVPTVLNYIPITLNILLWVIVLAIITGVVLTIIRVNKIYILAQIARVILSYSRGVPAVTQLFILYYGLPRFLLIFHIDVTRWDGLIFVILTYGLSMGSAVSENLRTSLQSVDRGQVEAGLAIGLSRWTTFRRVTFPLAMELALPNFSNIIVRALQNTSLAFSVGVIEMMTIGKQMGSVAMHPIEAYIALSIIYYAMYLIIVYLFQYLESGIIGGKVRKIA